MATYNKNNRLSIGAGDYAEIARQSMAMFGGHTQLIVPKEELQKVLSDEIKAFSEEQMNK